jgi:hypothetical protein
VAAFSHAENAGVVVGCVSIMLFSAVALAIIGPLIKLF